MVKLKCGWRRELCIFPLNAKSKRHRTNPIGCATINKLCSTVWHCIPGAEINQLIQQIEEDKKTVKLSPSTKQRSFFTPDKQCNSCGRDSRHIHTAIYSLLLYIFIYDIGVYNIYGCTINLTWKLFTFSLTRKGGVCVHVLVAHIAFVVFRVKKKATTTTKNISIFFHFAQIS